MDILNFKLLCMLAVA